MRKLKFSVVQVLEQIGLINLVYGKSFFSNAINFISYIICNFALCVVSFPAGFYFKDLILGGIHLINRYRHTRELLVTVIHYN